MIRVEEVWKSPASRRGEAVVVNSMTSFRNWPQFSRDAALDLPNLVMGKGSSLGLGVALARPERKVIVLDGDGSLLMNLGSLVTIANMQPKNLVHIVLQNGIYEITGGQPIPGTGKFDFVTLARGAGISRVFEFEELDQWLAQLDEVLAGDGPTFVLLHVTRAEQVPASPPRKTYQAFRDLRERLGVS